jgi:hypothetical protein
MNQSEYKIINEKENLIVCFGGMALQFGGILPFEFLRYLSTFYTDSCDLIFYIDKQQCWYHKGIDGITTTVDETVDYLNTIIRNKNYKKTIFMGVSAGGYASILYGSLCNVDYIISFVPQTILMNPINSNYINLKKFINTQSKYILHGDISIQDIHELHHISQCENIGQFTNVSIHKHHSCDIKVFRDTGVIKNILDTIIKPELNAHIS